VTGRAPALTAALTMTLLGVTVALGGCAPTGTARAGDDPERVEDRLVVLAAASLTDVVADLAERATADHPGLRVETTFGSSATLAAQVLAGAPADVLLTASDDTMLTVTDALGGEPVVVATNHLQLAVPAGNPGGVTSLADLADPDLTVALCAPQVPCGAVAADVLARAGVVAAPDTLERDVRAVLTRLTLDEADAGLVYRTDVRAADGAVEGIEVPQAADVATEHPALVVPGAPHPAAAAAFVTLLTGPDGRRAFAAAGFGPP